MLQTLVSREAACPFTVDLSNETESSNHFHSELEFIFLLSGKLTYVVGTDRVQLRARDFIFANPYEIHSVSQVSDDCRYLHILIEESRLRFLFSTSEPLLFHWKESLNNREHPLFRELSTAVRSIVIESTNQDSGYIAQIYQEVMHILIALNRECRQELSPDRSAKKLVSQQQKSSEIMDYINNHYMEQISLNTIAKAVYLSPPYISKIFKENFQVGFLEYLNRLRIQKSLYALCHTDAYIVDIAEDCGFTNAKTYSRLFQKEMGISPTDYRKQFIQEERPAQPLFPPTKSDFIQFLDQEDDTEGLLPGSGHFDSVPVKFDFLQKHEERKARPWNKVVTVGTAMLLLRSTVQNVILRAAEEFGAEYIRIVGVLSDGLQMYQEDAEGKPHYFWMLLDEILSFVTSHRLKPFLNLGFMPRKLAERFHPSPFLWDANTGKPQSMERWSNYLEEFLRHLVKLYSYEEVCTWRFEFWNDPLVKDVFWHDSPEDFREFFLCSYRAFRRVLPDGLFGSPGFAYFRRYEKTEEFLRFCKKEGVRFDFLCMHLFELTDPCNPDEAHKNRFSSLQMSDKHGSEFVEEAIERFREMSTAVGYSVPIYITEWNVSPYDLDLSRDTCFMSTYIVDVINHLPDCVESINFWSLMDYTSEHSPHQDLFIGELGQRTTNGLAKPSYLVFQLLRQMHGKVLASEANYFVTQSHRGYHIMLYNYSFFSEDFLNGTSRRLSQKDRYQIFETKREKLFNLHLTLEPGHYRIERHIVNREHGSIYDGWVNMGAPEFIDACCYGYLNKLAFPDISIQYKNIRGDLLFFEQVPLHGVLMISFIRLGDEK